MNRSDAKKIAETITNDHLLQMFNSAKENVADWTKVSNVNKGMTKGAVWNILAKDFDVSKKYHNLAKVNMIREFGEYLPRELKPIKEKYYPSKHPTHQEPNFDNY
ncbi:MAG: hypothetical protein QM653_15775 [Dysgonomonas sp.]|uniref:hypothetical protein n=1 Tax=Dysgonomonas sp. TaxID=1891233 RepID=UPI0039E498B5